MIVIGRVLDMEKQLVNSKELRGEDDDDEEEEILDITKCRVNVEQLLACQDLEYTIYNYSS